MTARNPLPRSFYLQPTVTVARQLLGKILVRRIGRRTLAGRIIEVEAYLGAKDPASHAYRGRTPRNDVMFWEGGHLYVYFTYGMHFCANVVSGPQGIGNAVLLRALEPLEGVRIMAENRKRDASAIKELCSGPAKLCQAFGIARGENGTDLCGKSIWIESDSLSRQSFRIKATPRIGISQGKDAMLRFVVREKTRGGSASATRGTGRK
ncbi:MAG: DNA-3-methyladenine glycosylase [Bacteroidetes bacterium]|nr:DNA-3-methyladenine glycosylase [Bacteroidota bacterium]